MNNATHLDQDQQPQVDNHIDNSLVEETRTFWKQRGQALVGDSPKAIDDIARQIVTVSGVIVGFYVNAIARTDFRTQIQDWWLRLLYVAPILVLLGGIIFGFLVFLPGKMNVNINSSTACKLAHERTVQRKWRLLWLASIWMVLGIISLATALVSYFVG